MEKTNIENFINTCKSCGIEEYGFRHNGGSRVPRHGKDLGVISLKGDNVITLERNVDYGNSQPFIVSYIPIEDIMFFFAPNLSTQTTITFLEGLGVWEDPNMQEFVKNHGNRTRIVPGSGSAMAVAKDSDNNTMLFDQSSGYITK